MTPRDEAIFVPAIDIPLLRELPQEGTKVGIMPVTATARWLHGKYPELSTNLISGRLRAMEGQGYAVAVIVPPVSRGLGYQITPAGEARIREEGAA